MNTIYAGVDIGASSTDVVLIDRSRQILASCVRPTNPIHWQASEQALLAACEQVRCRVEDITYVVGTGYGRKNVKASACQITEIACHAKGACYRFPGTRTILDIGGQDSKAIKVNESGNVVDFAMNEKCAAGTGRFLEAMSRALAVELEEMGPLSFRFTRDVRLSSVCTVFAESEVISKIAEGERVEDIINGIHHAICDRTLAILERVKAEPPLVMTGGVAKNQGIVQLLQQKLKYQIVVPEEPQIIGALGAALFALEKASE